MSITQSAAAGSVTSADGTTIGYRRIGDGPGIVLVHSGGQSSRNLMALAAALSDRFTVYVPDRRGRGVSGPCREDDGRRAETEDLAAILDRTRAHNIFGLSVGALIAIEAARDAPRRSPGWQSTSRRWSSTASPRPHGCPATSVSWRRAARRRPGHHHERHRRPDSVPPHAPVPAHHRARPCHPRDRP